MTTQAAEKYNVQPGEPWHDISLRRPREPYDRSGNLPPPTETHTSKVTRDDGEEIELTLEGFKEDAPSTIISSGLALSDVSDLLCGYMTTDRDFRESSCLRILELGAGLGKCGIVAHRLAHPPHASTSPLQPGRTPNTRDTVLTDGDTNALQLLRKNVASNIDSPLIQCQQLVWGKEAAQLFLRKQNNRPFDIIIGSDIIYKCEVYLRGLIDELFETVDVLLGKNGKFLLAHDESHEVRIETVNWGGDRHNLLHELVNQDGQKQLFCYRRLTTWNANSVIRRLTEKNFALEAGYRAIRAEKGHTEERCRCLEERFAANVGGKNILSLGVDCIASVASFLGGQDLASVSSTCKQFGQKLHKIGTRPVPLWHMVAHGLFESASDREKESLPAYSRESSPLFLYNELVELRKPLVFDRSFGRNIDHAIGDPARVVQSNRSGVIRLDPRAGFSRRANTAVSNHVMRAGKHYVTFTCPEGPDEIGNLLWFGIVRPLQSLGPRGKSLFTPFCSRFVSEWNELRREEWGESADCCVYVASTGSPLTDGECLYKDWSDSSTVNEVYSAGWQGMQPFAGRGKVGMLLDCDAGTLTVYLNDKRLGVMKKGLAGPYTWMVSVAERNLLRVGVGIERAWGFDSARDESCITPRKRGLAKISTNDE